MVYWNVFGTGEACKAPDYDLSEPLLKAAGKVSKQQQYHDDDQN
jgi:hypothetical protein